MRHADLEHVIAAAADITGDPEIVVIGSQAILGSYPDAPETLLRSMEADVFPHNDPAKADDIDWHLGDGSQFHTTYGYFAHGVGPETAKAPSGWRERLVRVEIAPRGRSTVAAAALCLEPHDLVLAKCVAGRPRDWDFARDALAAGLVRPEELLDRIDDLPVPDEGRQHVRRQLTAILGDPTAS